MGGPTMRSSFQSTAFRLVAISAAAWAPSMLVAMTFTRAVWLFTLVSSTTYGWSFFNLAVDSRR